QQIAAVRRELLQSAAEGGHPAFVTVLSSATLTDARIRYLVDLFGQPGPVHHVHAVRLRPEPSYWIAEAPSEDVRRDWVLEAVDHIPRPLILYTVRRAQAEDWYKLLAAQGFRRLGLIHGGTPRSSGAHCCVRGIRTRST